METSSNESERGNKEMNYEKFKSKMIHCKMFEAAQVSIRFEFNLTIEILQEKKKREVRKERKKFSFCSFFLRRPEFFFVFSDISFMRSD